MSLQSRIALIGLRTQPESIIDQLLDNEEFRSFVNLGFGEYPGLGAFDHGDVAAALQVAWKENRPVTVRTKQGKECSVERTLDGIRAKLIGVKPESEARLVSEFRLFDPDPGIRLAGFHEISRACRPFIRALEYWHSVVEARPITELELGKLMNEISRTPGVVIDAVAKKWSRDNVNVLDIFPTSPDYYEKLVGPKPVGLSPDEYVAGVLRPHHSDLLKADAESALEYVMAASIRHDISCADLVKEFSDDAVWNALACMGQIDTPFALIGALEIALSRGADARFIDYAATAVERLAGRQLLGVDKQDAYQLMPPLVRLSLYWFATSKELHETAPYWRRLVAFVHCHFLLRTLRTKQIDPEQFSAWCDSHLTREMINADLLDVQREPMWRADELGALSLRAEVIGRLSLLISQADAKGLLVPNRRLIEGARSEMSAAELLPAWFCGPLEGHSRRRLVQTAPNAAMKETIEGFGAVIADVRQNTLGNGWTKLSFHSHLYAFDDRMLLELTEVAQGMVLPEEAEKRVVFFSNLASAAYVAASQPHEPLGEAVAAVLMREAGKFQSIIDVEIGYRVLLMASAAICEREKWLQWLEQKLEAYSYAIPKGEACARIYDCLNALTVLFPIKDWRFGKARKLAAGAMR
jgi:hypothetical protein